MRALAPVAVHKNTPFVNRSYLNRFVCAGVALALGAGSVGAQECSALIDKLVRKKVLTAQEGEDVRADLVKENVSTQKVVVDSFVKELTLSGDLRLRYEYFNIDPQFDYKAPNGDPGHGTQSSRLRFRLRLNAEFKLTDNWFGGVQLTTGKTSDTGSQSYLGGFQNYDIYISRAYFGWKNDADWLTLIGGKQPNPFYTTDMVWDPNIDPGGFVEQVKLHRLLAGENPFARDGKGTAASAPASPWELTFTAGQFCFDDNKEDGLAGMNTDAWLFEQQLLFSYKFHNGVKFTIAPTYLTYNGAQVNESINTQPFSQATDGLPPGTGETKYLSLIQIPGDISFKLGSISTKFLWDFTYNTEGNRRVRDIYGIDGTMEVVTTPGGKTLAAYRRSTHSSQDDYAWQAGFLFGQNIKKGDWSLLVAYRQVGLGAVDPNLTCSDFALSRLNVQGWKISLAYNLTNAAVFQATWFGADNLRKDLIGGQATGGAKIADSNNVQLVTLDLNVKL